MSVGGPTTNMISAGENLRAEHARHGPLYATAVRIHHSNAAHFRKWW